MARSLLYRQSLPNKSAPRNWSIPFPLDTLPQLIGVSVSFYRLIARRPWYLLLITSALAPCVMVLSLVTLTPVTWLPAAMLSLLMTTPLAGAFLVLHAGDKPSAPCALGTTDVLHH